MQENQASQEETIDIKALILKYSQYWYYFVASILFFEYPPAINELTRSNAC